MVEFCAERGLRVGNTYFKHTRVARDQDGVEQKSMIDLVLVKYMLSYVHDVTAAVRGMG